MPKLAINGGPRLRVAPPPAWPRYDERDLKALEEVLNSGQWGIGGSKVGAFEERFAAYQDARHGVAVCNGTIALEVALRAAGIGAGDEVIVPAYTFMATPAAVLAVNALPVFADVDAETCTMDPVDAAVKITPATRALMPVHLAGCPADMDAYRDLAARHRLKLIEDACQAWGAGWKGKKVGALGDLGAFSFQSSKNLNCGEGGIVLTNDEALFDLAWSYHNCGRVREGRWYQHEVLGLNYRMTEFQAALLLTQMERLPDQSALRARGAAYLDRKLAGLEGITTPTRPSGVTAHANHIYILRYHADAFGGLARDRFVEALNAEGIPCGAGYVPLYAEGFMRQLASDRHLRDLYGDRVDYGRVRLPRTESASRESVWFPQYLLLGAERDLDDVANAIRKIRENLAELRAG